MALWKPKSEGLKNRFSFTNISAAFTPCIFTFISSKVGSKSDCKNFLSALEEFADNLILLWERLRMISLKLKQASEAGPILPEPGGRPHSCFKAFTKANA